MSRKSAAGARGAAHEADDLEGDMTGTFPVAALSKPQAKATVRKVTAASKGKQVAKPVTTTKAGPGRKPQAKAKSKQVVDVDDENDDEDDPLNGGTNISPVMSREVNGKATPPIKEESQAPYVPGSQNRTRYTIIMEDEHGNLGGAGAQVEVDGDFQFTPSNPKPRRGAAQGAKVTAASRKRQLEVAQDQDHTAKRRRTEEYIPQPLSVNESTLPLKFEELSKKYELLQQHFTELREIGIVEADRNYDNLRKMALEQEQANEITITSLRQELTEQRSLNEIVSKANEGNVGMLELAKNEAEAQTRNLVKALGDMQAENRALHTKLAAARASSMALEAPAAGRSVTSSAAKNRTVVVGSADAAAQAQVAQLKEDLYSDLTGLIVRAVDRQDDGDVYDCIQTGRNGTLHFKLGISLDHDNTTSWDDNVFIYEPQLDMSRDRSLLDVLPDYLTEEISFPRAQAAKFYARVVDAITRQPQIREDEDDE